MRTARETRTASSETLSPSWDSDRKNSPAAAGTNSNRSQDNGLGVCPPVAMSGRLTTRRSPAIAAPITSAGIVTATRTFGTTPSAKSCANQVPPSHETYVATACSSGPAATPSAAPATAASPVSAATIAITCAGVAPASRSAASRRSRRAAVSRDADATSTRLGTSSTTTPTPDSSASSGSTWARPDPSVGRCRAFWGIVSLLCPTRTTSCSGKRSASSPSRPTGRAPPNRSPSCAAGRLPTRAARSGESSISPGPGSRSMPAGSWTVDASTSGATSTRVIRLPSTSSSALDQLTSAGPEAVPSGVCHRVRSARAFVANGRLTSSSTRPVATATPSAVSSVETCVRRSARSTRSASWTGFMRPAPPARSVRPGWTPCAGRPRRAHGRASR